MYFIWMAVAMGALVFVAATSAAHAQEIPGVNDEPKAERKLDFDAFENITKLLAAGKLSPHMKCDLKVRTLREERRFSEATKWVEILQIEYSPRGLFSETKMSISIPAELSTYGTRYASNPWSGVGEDIKIEAHDSDDHWLRFIHDGKGRLVFFSLGNRLATYPCFVK